LSEDEDEDSDEVIDGDNGIECFWRKPTDFELPPLSLFASIWDTLSSWVTPLTRMFLQDDMSYRACNMTYFSSEKQHFMEENEGLQRLVPVDSLDVFMVKRKLLMEMLTRHLPTLLRDLHLNTQHLEQEIFELVGTLNLRDSISSSTPQYWRVIALVFLKAISCRNAVLQKELEASDLLLGVVASYGLQVDEFSILIDVFAEPKSAT